MSALGRDPRQDVADRDAAVHCLVDGAGKQRGREVVLARREAHRDFAFRAAVQLRRTSRAGSLAAGEPAELRREQSVGDEPVEVECGDRPRDPDRGGGFVLGDRVATSDHELVEGTSLRFRE